MVCRYLYGMASLWSACLCEIASADSVHAWTPAVTYRRELLLFCSARHCFVSSKWRNGGLSLAEWRENCCWQSVEAAATGTRHLTIVFLGDSRGSRSLQTKTGTTGHRETRALSSLRARRTVTESSQSCCQVARATAPHVTRPQ